MKAFRERRAWNQVEFAGWLNERLNRRYDNRRVSRWESGTEAIPQPVAALLRQESKGAELGGGPALSLVTANQKGGVGKTVSCVNIATMLARSASVLLVDMDPQANATLHVGIDPSEAHDRRRTLANVFRGELTLNDVVVVLDSGLHVAPSSIALSEVEAELMSEPLGALTMRELLADARKIYDFILLDTAPNLGMLTVNGITAADTVLIPCQPEMPAIVGIEYLMRTIGKVQRRTNAALSVLGILPSMVSSRLTSDRAMMQVMTEQYGGRHRIFDPVPRSTVFSQANAAALPTVLAAPDFPGRAAFESVVEAAIAERAKRLESAHAA